MKIKLFSSCETENEVNKFLDTGVDVIDIKFATTESSYDVMVIYNEKTENENT